MALIVYVDNVLLTGNNNNSIENVKQFLHSDFTIKDLDEADFFLWIQLTKTDKGLAISQQKYIQDIL